MKLSTRKTLPTVIMVAITLIVLCIAAFAAQGAELGTERFYNTPWALLPPVIAITLALVTKEVYSSLFVGILAGGLLYSNFSFEGTILHVFNDGIVSVLSDSYNVGILVFLVILGVMVCLMNKAGGSAAFGRWAAKNIKSRAGAQLATIALGILIFIDDYFNCLTVGTVMKPVTDSYKISRAKLAYIISPMHEEITRRLLEMDLGVTLLEGSGAYAHRSTEVVMCAFSRSYVIPVKKLVQSIAPHAFVIVCASHEILGAAPAGAGAGPGRAVFSVKAIRF